MELSELRAMYIESHSFNNPDWETIAQNCKSYGVNMLLIDVLTPYFARYPSIYLPGFNRDNVGMAVTACHSRNMKCLPIFLMGIGPYTGTEAVGPDGGTRAWTCFSKQSTRNHFKNLMEELMTKWDIDGIVLDYGRYDSQDVCYCDDCRAKFAQYLGETITVSDFRTGGKFAPGGSRYSEFMDWRSHPINEMVALIRGWAQAIKPYLEIVACPWGWIPGQPQMNVYYLGQDPMAWIKDGNADWITPMSFYTQRDPSTARNHVLQYHQDLGGPEGVVPIIPFLDPNAPEFGYCSPAQFAAIVDAIRAAGADGFCINRYGGPGDGTGSGNADITPYLAAMSRPPVFSVKNIAVILTEIKCTITWTTDLPATSKVEYSTKPLFTAIQKMSPNPAQLIHYWDVDHVAGTIIEDLTLKTTHSLSFSIQPGVNYYFRVSSNDKVSGIATSPQMTTLEVPPPPPEFVTPWTGTLEDGTYRINVPQQVQVGSDIYNFKQWEDGSTNPERLISLTADKTITATYELVPPIEYTLTINTTAGGATEPVPGSYTYPENMTVKVTAKPDANYNFSHWVLDGTEYTTNPLSVVMNKDKILTAYFSETPPPPPPTYNLTIAATTGGNTEPVPGIYEADAGDIITVIATSFEGYVFKRFELDGEVKMQNPINVGMDADHTLLAVFETAAPPVPASAAILFMLALSGSVGALSISKKGGG